MNDVADGRRQQPTLFPLPMPIREYFAEAEGSWFGWTKDHFRIMRPAHVTRSQFPLSQDGWDAAWQVIVSDHPQLADAITLRLRQSRELTLLYDEYQGQETWADVHDCTLVGGYGWNLQEVPFGTQCTLHFTSDGLWIMAPSGWAPLLRSAYSEAMRLDFSALGGVWGTRLATFAGSGLLHSTQGELAFPVISGLASQTRVHTLIQYKAHNMELLFLHSKSKPDSLSARLSRVVREIDSAPRAKELGQLYDEFERHEVWDELDACKLIGGYGWDLAKFPSGRDCVLRFTADQLWVRPPNHWIPLLRVSYSDAIALDFSGPGKITKGGGLFGGGLGLAGIAEGIVAATVINALTSSTEVKTIVSYRARDLEVFFLHSKTTPEDLRIRLSRVVNQMNARTQADVPPLNVTTELARFAALHREGILTDKEFADIKARLIASL